jgi:hypothetical protein
MQLRNLLMQGKQQDPTYLSTVDLTFSYLGFLGMRFGGTCKATANLRYAFLEATSKNQIIRQACSSLSLSSDCDNDSTTHGSKN